MDYLPIPQFCRDFLLESQTYLKKSSHLVQIENSHAASLVYSNYKLQNHTIIQWFTLVQSHTVTHYFYRFVAHSIATSNVGPLFESNVACTALFREATVYMVWTHVYIHTVSNTYVPQ